MKSNLSLSEMNTFVLIVLFIGLTLFGCSGSGDDSSVIEQEPNVTEEQDIDEKEPTISEELATSDEEIVAEGEQEPNVNEEQTLEVEILSEEESDISEAEAADTESEPAFLNEIPIGTLLFSIYEFSKTDIYILQNGEKTFVNLTNNPARDGGPTLSRDGLKVAFVSDRDEASGIYVMDIDGNNVMQVVNFASGSPAWSPDGTQIAFVASMGGPVGNIFITDLNGSFTQLTESTRPNSSPSWSPDGTRVAYSCWMLGETICIYDLDSSQVSILYKDENNEPFWVEERVSVGSVPWDGLRFPEWSPVDEEIVFELVLEGERQVCVINTTSADLDCLTEPSQVPIESPTWAPNGKYIIYDSNEEFYMVDVETRQLTPLTEFNHFVRIGSPDW
ncbi:MAG: hypothetical protein R3D55_13980 [Chloroflexota bacterium]